MDNLFSEKTFRALYNKQYDILLDDIDKSFNINSHSFSCFAISKEEAIGKMIIQRPEFRNRNIRNIRELDSKNVEVIYLNISEDDPLSNQLKRITESSWNSVDFEPIEGKLLTTEKLFKHKEIERIFGILNNNK